jgi:hypothetical protein
MNKINTRKALNPAYRKHKPIRKEVNNFVTHLKECLVTIKISDQNNESEEHIKDPIKKFLQSTFYQNHLVNTKDRIDLAIYSGENAKSDVAVIIEAKRPSNKSEFLTTESLNRKALQELVLYYLRERIDCGNNNIKHLIATNGYEWFLFKADDFYKYFYSNKALVKEYEAFKSGLKDSSKNELFYNDIAKKYIAEIEDKLPFVYLNFYKSDFDKFSDAHLNTLFKIFSNVHILGHSFGNDSNQLNQAFYHELLHIIGLEEIKEKGKKVINRKTESERDYASLLENTIFTLEDRDYLHNVKTITGDDKAFEIGLELCLTWINRILFLKLLESQLSTYHKGAKEYRFLNSDFIDGFDELNNLFFSALAKKTEERHPKFKDKYKFIPYLNSSLFERNELESETFEISALNDDKIEVYSGTVLKDAKGKRFKGKLNTLDYLFKFLDAFDFATDGTEGISDENETKSLINASVLGLIFEKINGYKEGSFYTPAFITMYMCKETLRKAVVKKFKEQENSEIDNFDDLKAYCHRYFKAEDTARFNAIVNSLKICDPAVGSGHFLVSALNEIIAIKNELGILVDAKGIPLRCDLYIENDELYITDSQGLLFEYNPKDVESVRIQHTLFTEKQTIIENCLFGVDINSNSVKICRLRLWIELLKNAYYTKENELQTLPNIDINIKSGNSLISRFDLTDDLKDAFKGKEVNYSFKDYKAAVEQYKNTNDKQVKRDVLNIINEVKNNFKSSIDKKFANKLINVQKEYNLKEQQLNNLKQFNETITKAEKEKLKELKLAVEKALKEKEEIVNNAIYHNAFEWRFEFPEVLDEEGNYIGFDAVIGNPPYVQLQSLGKIGKDYGTMNFETYTSSGDLYALFYEQGNNVLRDKGLLCFITGSAWMRSNYGKPLRNYFNSKTTPLELIDLSDCEVFDSATVLTNIMLFQKGKEQIPTKALRLTRKDQKLLKELGNYFKTNYIEIEAFTDTAWIISNKELFEIKRKVEEQGVKVKDWELTINRGILTGYNEAFIIPTEIKEKLIQIDPKSSELLKPILRGRDVDRYSYDYAELWLVATFPSRNIDIEEYPAIRDYLKSFGKRLEQTGEKGSRKKTSGKWFEIQDSISYWQEFEKPKIIYPNMTKFLPFTFDNNKYYTNQKCFIITGNNLEYLTAFLNSRLFKICFEENFPELQGNTRELNKVVFEEIPIKQVTSEQNQKFAIKVNEIISLKEENPNADTSDLEKELDQMVYGLYGLSEEEIKIVEEN